jgi:hypothetical protein
MCVCAKLLLNFLNRFITMAFEPSFEALKVAEGDVENVVAGILLFTKNCHTVREV